MCLYNVVFTLSLRAAGCVEKKLEVAYLACEYSMGRAL